jgi:hypothetical protein
LLDWIRKNNVSTDSIDDPTALAIDDDVAQLDNKPLRAIAPDQKRSVKENAMEWFAAKNPNLKRSTRLSRI